MKRKLTLKETTEFWRYMSLCTSAQMNFRDSLKVTSEAASTKRLTEVCNEIKEHVENGKMLGEGMRATKAFDPVSYQVARFGETAGKMEEVSSALARSLREELSQSKGNPSSPTAAIVDLLGLGILIWKRMCVPYNQSQTVY